jgi:hypothetical protein
MHFTRLALGAFMCTAIGLVAAADGPRMEDDVLNAASDQSEQQYPLIYLSDLVATSYDGVVAIIEIAVAKSAKQQQSGHTSKQRRSDVSNLETGLAEARYPSLPASNGMRLVVL